jgi:hypothetical protein
MMMESIIILIMALSLIVAAPAILLYRLVVACIPSARPVVACTSCEHVGRAKKHFPGNILFFVVLCLFFVVPGLIYGAWCVLSNRHACKACGSLDIVPIDTPAGRRLAGQSVEISSQRTAMSL